MRSHGVSISVASSAFCSPKIHSLRVHFRLKKGQGAEGKGQKARGKEQRWGAARRRWEKMKFIFFTFIVTMNI